ncbi:MAG: dihydrolipoyl dehydrogenase [Candidatus Omnitrophica bacterium]|nr:dihydrolipoyl dehydrogenase [Candidatus Omnitrophota bacterium]
MENKYGLVVLGSGPGGYTAALRAAALGQSVCLIEKEKIGGVCLNWGCIPTKSLLKSAHFFDSLKKSEIFGVKIKPGSIELDFSAVQQRKKEIVDKLTKGIEFLLQKRKVRIVKGQGRFLDKNRIDVQGEVINFDKCVIATGSYPAELKNIKFDDALGIVSNRGGLSFTHVPKSLLIIGGGVIGCEFADIYAALGSEVTIIEVAERLLPNEDKDIVRVLTNDFKKRKIKIFTQGKVESVSKSSNSQELLIKLSQGQELSAEKVLLSVGRIPNIDNCGLENLGLDMLDGRIKVNEQMQTSISTIYAIGDAVGKNFLAHVASHQGIIVAENIAGNASRMNYANIPRCVYSHPEIASIGISQEQAEKQGLKIKIGKFPLLASGRALIEDDSKGMIKIIVQASDDRIIGACLSGPMATEIVHEIAVAMNADLTVKQLAGIIYAHPTVSESIMEAALDSDGQAIHLIR